MHTLLWILGNTDETISVLFHLNICLPPSAAWKQLREWQSIDHRRWEPLPTLVIETLRLPELLADSYLEFIECFAFFEMHCGKCSFYCSDIIGASYSLLCIISVSCWVEIPLIFTEISVWASSVPRREQGTYKGWLTPWWPKERCGSCSTTKLVILYIFICLLFLDNLTQICLASLIENLSSSYWFYPLLFFQVFSLLQYWTTESASFICARLLGCWCQSFSWSK